MYSYVLFEVGLFTGVDNPVENYMDVINKEVLAPQIYRQRVAREKPTPMKAKPTTMFHAPILGMG